MRQRRALGRWECRATRSSGALGLVVALLACSSSESTSTTPPRDAAPEDSTLAAEAAIAAGTDAEAALDAGELSDAGLSDGSALLEAGALPALTWTVVVHDFGGDDLVSIWGSGSTDVYVGTDFGHIHHMSNGVWATTASVGNSASIGAGWASDPQNVFAVGSSAWMGIGNGALLHSSGDGGWSTVTQVGSGFDWVWGTSANDVYAVGGAGTLHSRDGGLFVGESSGGSLLSIWGSGAGDVYGTTPGSSGTVVHSSGDGGWQVQYSQLSDEPWVVAGGGPSAVYAILSPDNYNYPTATVLHSAGDGGWTVEKVDSNFTMLVALWASGPHDVYAGGWHEDDAGMRSSGALYHSSGDGVWTPLDLGMNQVRCIWGSSAADVYVGGFDFVHGTVLQHGHL
jgi:hypothetical protein